MSLLRPNPAAVRGRWMNSLAPRLPLCAVLAVLLAGLSACTSTAYREEPEAIRLTFGSGGLLAPIRARYERFAQDGRPVIIDGQMISADAFYAFSLDNACYTENAVFSPHAASYLGLIPARAHTEALAALLPDALEQWFRRNIAFYDWIGFARLDYADLLGVWPEGACAEDPEAELARLREEGERSGAPMRQPEL